MTNGDIFLASILSENKSVSPKGEPMIDVSGMPFTDGEIDINR